MLFPEVRVQERWWSWKIGADDDDLMHGGAVVAEAEGKVTWFDPTLSELDLEVGEDRLVPCIDVVRYTTPGDNRAHDEPDHRPPMLERHGNLVGCHGIDR